MQVGAAVFKKLYGGERERKSENDENWRRRRRRVYYIKQTILT